MIGGDLQENNLEIQRALEILKYPNRIQSVIVGNEVLLRKELEPLELYAYIDFMKSHTKKKKKKPVTTAETWDIWEKIRN